MQIQHVGGGFQFFILSQRTQRPPANPILKGSLTGLRQRLEPSRGQVHPGGSTAGLRQIKRGVPAVGRCGPGSFQELFVGGFQIVSPGADLFGIQHHSDGCGRQQGG